MRTLNIVILFLIAACNAAPPPQNTSPAKATDHVTLTEAQMKNAGIETGLIQKQPLNTILKVNGTVDVPPQNIVSISFPLGGYLKSTLLLPGMHVNKGEEIARVEDQTLIQLQQDFLIEKNKLVFLEKDFERQQTLNENKVNSDKVFQQASANYNTQKVLVKGYEEKLRLIGIRPEKLTDANISRSVAIYSPINGFVSKVNVNIGKYVNPSDVLFELINPDDIHAALTVFEKDLEKVAPKQKVMISFVDEPGKEYEGEVLLITKNVDDNRSALVHCHFEKQPKKLLPGMFLNAAIHIANINALAVPESAIVRHAKNQYVLINTDESNFRLQQVVTGIEQNGLVEISATDSNLEGKKVITHNAYAVLSKMKNIPEDE